MTVELRTLRVSAEMDASKYVAGAKAVEGSSTSAGKAVGGLGASVQQTDNKISQSGDVLTRLSRQYVDGYAAAQRMQQAVNSLSRGIDSGRITMAQAEPILEGIYRKYGQLGSGATFAAKGQVELAAAIDRTTAKMQAQSAVSARLPAGANDISSFRRQNLTYQLFDVGTSLSGGMNPALIAAQQGPQILQLYAGQGGIRAAISDSLGLALRLTRAMGPFAVAAGAGALAIQSMRDEIEATTGKAVTFGQVAGAVLKTIASDIYGLVEPAVDAIAPWFQLAWDKVSAGAIYAGNMIINSFHAAYEDVKYVWGQFPNMIGTLVISGLNVVVGGIENMVQTGADYIDAFIAKINIALAKISEVTGVSLSQIPNIGDLGLGVPIQDPFAAPLADATADRNRRIGEIMGSDPLGDYYRSVRDRSKADLSSGKGGAADPWVNLRDTDKAALDRYRDAIKAADDAVKQNRDTFRGFLGDLKEGILAGEKLGEVLKNAFGNLLNTFADRALDNLADMIFPTSKTGGNAGPLGILGALFGAGKSVAANDNWGGLRSANDNFSAPVGKVTRAPLADISGFRNAIKSIESAGSGGYSALGPVTKGDRAYGAYQVMGNNVGPWSEAALGRRLTPSQFLNDPSAQDAVFDHRFGGYVDKYGPQGAAQAWFGGPGSVGKGGMGTDILGTSGNAYVEKFNSSLKNLDGTVTAATKNLDQFGGGLGQLGNALTQFPAAPGGGGAGGMLGSLFGGLSSAFSGTKAFSFLSANPGKFINFYADGTDSAEPGVAMVGERGPEMVRFRGGERVIPNHKLGGANSNTFAPTFNIDARGSSMTRAEYESITQRALAQYDEQQKRGGAAAMNKRHNALRA